MDRRGILGAAESVDLRGNPQEQLETETRRLLQEGASRSFDIERDILVRVLLIQTEEREWSFLVVTPHRFGSLVLAHPLPGTSGFISSPGFRPARAPARIAHPICRLRVVAAGLVAARRFERAGRFGSDNWLALPRYWNCPRIFRVLRCKPFRVLASTCRSRPA